MMTFTVSFDSLATLADIFEDLVYKIDAHLESEFFSEEIEFSEDGYYYDEENDELYFVDFNDGVEYYYDLEADKWYETGEVLKFADANEDEIEE